MTAEHILSRWRRVEPMLQHASKGKTYLCCFSPQSMWFFMLSLADGQRHTSRSLAKALNKSLSKTGAMLRFLECYSLIQAVGKMKGAGNNPCIAYAATPKLYEVLALQMPAAKTEPDGVKEAVV